MYCCEAANSCEICSFRASPKLAMSATLALPTAPEDGEGPPRRRAATALVYGASGGDAVDRLRERDLPRLLLLRLLDANLEHAVVVIRHDLVLVHALREADGPAEAAESALEPVVAILGDLLGLLALGRDRQGLVLHLDRDLLLGNPRKIERVDDVAVRLPDVERRHPGARLTRLTLEEAVQPPVHVLMKRRQLAERLPANECRHCFSSFVVPADFNIMKLE